MTKEKKHGIIYSLSDESGIRYIGQTRNLTKRFGQHCSIAQNRGNTKLNRWITVLLTEQGIVPILGVIERTNKLDEREKYWISYYKNKGVSLLNMTSGGFDIAFLKREKASKPWGRFHSPLQKRMMELSRYLNSLKRRGENNEYLIWKEKLISLNKKIRKIGANEMNKRLLMKYGC